MKLKNTLFSPPNTGYNIPVQIGNVRTTIGKPKVEPKPSCPVCGKIALKFDNQFMTIVSVMCGDFDYIPIDSEADRCYFCWECFETSADSKIVDLFRKYGLFSGIDVATCIYCTKPVVPSLSDLQKFFKIIFTFKTGGQNSCLIHEQCYKENINV